MSASGGVARAKRRRKSWSSRAWSGSMRKAWPQRARKRRSWSRAVINAAAAFTRTRRRWKGWHLHDAFARDLEHQIPRDGSGRRRRAAAGRCAAAARATGRRAARILGAAGRDPDRSARPVGAGGRAAGDAWPGAGSAQWRAVARVLALGISPWSVLDRSPLPAGDRSHAGAPDGLRTDDAGVRPPACVAPAHDAAADVVHQPGHADRLVVEDVVPDSDVGFGALDH